MPHREELSISYLPDFIEISRHPAIRELQLLQLSAEQENDRAGREDLYAHLMPLAARPILGRMFVVDASLVVGSGSEAQYVFENGLTFLGKATSVNPVVDLTVPTDSLGIIFETPRTVAADTGDDLDLAQELAVSETVELSHAWVPIMAIKRCAVELPKAA